MNATAGLKIGLPDRYPNMKGAHLFAHLLNSSAYSCRQSLACGLAAQNHSPLLRNLLLSCPRAGTLQDRQQYCRSHKRNSSAEATGSIANQSAGAEQPMYDGLPKLLVFGGNGYVGSRVCEEAVDTGLQIVSINRSGRPGQSAPWLDQVDWVQADVFDVAKWRPQLEGALGVISCLGAFGSNEFMYKMCGESNATVFREAAAAGVARAAFISAADFKQPDWFLPGYFKGKRYAEQVLSQTFPEGGVALRPGFIHGTRNVGGIGIPLSAVGWPLQKVLSYLPTKELAKYPILSFGVVPPVSVQAVAKAAVAAATDSVIPPGPLDVWEIQKYDE